MDNYPQSEVPRAHRGDQSHRRRRRRGGDADAQGLPPADVDVRGDAAARPGRGEESRRGPTRRWRVVRREVGLSSRAVAREVRRRRRRRDQVQGGVSERCARRAER
eukprot:29471-Pelagococcus_subviridis.AAC.3